MVIAHDFSTTLLQVIPTTIKINRGTSELNSIIGQRDFRHLQNISIQTLQSTHFLAAWRAFSKKKITIGYKESLNKHGEIEITSCILFDYNGIRLYQHQEDLQDTHELMEIKPCAVVTETH